MISHTPSQIIRQGVIILAVSWLFGQTLAQAADTYAIGDRGPAGGIVFYVKDGGLHGLEAAPEDQGSASWGCYGTYISGAVGTAISTGAANTTAIVAGCAEPGIAARVASDYSINGFGDWFLPSKDELALLYAHRTVVGAFAYFDYWSSSQLNGNNAWIQSFTSDSQSLDIKYAAFSVRAVRAF